MEISGASALAWLLRLRKPWAVGESAMAQVQPAAGRNPVYGKRCRSRRYRSRYGRS